MNEEGNAMNTLNLQKSNSWGSGITSPIYEGGEITGQTEEKITGK